MEQQQLQQIRVQEPDPLVEAYQILYSFEFDGMIPNLDEIRQYLSQHPALLDSQIFQSGYRLTLRVEVMEEEASSVEEVMEEVIQPLEVEAIVEEQEVMEEETEESEESEDFISRSYCAFILRTSTEDIVNLKRLHKLCERIPNLIFRLCFFELEEYPGSFAIFKDCEFSQLLILTTIEPRHYCLFESLQRLRIKAKYCCITCECHINPNNTYNFRQMLNKINMFLRRGGVIENLEIRMYLRWDHIALGLYNASGFLQILQFIKYTRRLEGALHFAQDNILVSLLWSEENLIRSFWQMWKAIYSRAIAYQNQDEE